MFIATLFVIAETWKQPIFPIEGEWIKTKKNCGKIPDNGLFNTEKKQAVKPQQDMEEAYMHMTK